MIIESIRNYISTCPYISEFAKEINVDYLSEEANSYSIEEVPCEPILKKYVNGASKKQYVFTFSSRESYGADVLQNIKNSGFYENFTNWLEEKTIKGELPILEGKKSLEIEVMETGYVFETNVDKAIYKIKIRLIYFEGGF